MKKFIYSSFAIILFLLVVPTVNATAYYTNDNNIEMTEQQYNNLIQLGFTESEIYQMGNEEFEANKDVNATLVSENQQYYKTTTTIRNGITTKSSEVITEEQYQAEKDSNTPQTRSYDAIVTTEYKQMRTSISKYSDIKYRYKVTLTWLNMPSKRSYDIIGLGYQQAIVYMSLAGVQFQQNYTISGTNYSSVVCTPLEFDTGASAVFLLPSGTLSALSSYMYYEVLKYDDTYTITEMYAGGDYAHATSTISKTNAQKHSVNHGTGIVLQSSISGYYDGIPVAQAIWEGTW